MDLVGFTEHYLMIKQCSVSLQGVHLFSEYMQAIMSFYRSDKSETAFFGRGTYHHPCVVEFIHLDLTHCITSSGYF